MTHLKRLAVEHAGQAVSIAVSLLDRVLLTAVLYRLWGAVQFELWAACVALAGFVSIFELGFNLYFNNRITFETERGQAAAARRTYFISNTIFFICAAVGFLGGLFGKGGTKGGGKTMSLSQMDFVDLVYSPLSGETGGFTSMDCSRTSIRQGAKEVTLVYRRDMKDMPAANEVHEAIEEGVTAIFQAGPVRVVTDRDNNVTGVE